MARQHRKVVPHGGQHPTHSEWYDDETGKLLPPPGPDEELTPQEEADPEPLDGLPHQDPAATIGNREGQSETDPTDEEVDTDGTGEQTETTDAGGSDGATPEPEVPVKPSRRRKASKAEPEDGDGGGSPEAA